MFGVITSDGTMATSETLEGIKVYRDKLTQAGAICSQIQHRPTLKALVKILKG